MFSFILLTVLWDHLISNNARKNVFKNYSLISQAKTSQVKSSAIWLYGCETWTITKYIGAVSCYRIILNIKRLEKVSHDLIYDLPGTSPLLSTIISRQFKFLGYILPTEKDEPANIYPSTSRETTLVSSTLALRSTDDNYDDDKWTRLSDLMEVIKVTLFTILSHYNVDLKVLWRRKTLNCKSSWPFEHRYVFRRLQAMTAYSRVRDSRNKESTNKKIKREETAAFFLASRHFFFFSNHVLLFSRVSLLSGRLEQGNAVNMMNTLIHTYVYWDSLYRAFQSQ